MIPSLTLAAADQVLVGEAPGDLYGFDLAAAGDVNGDGYDDLLVGTPFAREGLGQVALHLGGPDGLAPAPAWRRVGRTVGCWMGRTLRGVGDLDGDGLDDVLVGEARSPEGPTAWLFAGTPTGLAAEPFWTAVPTVPTTGDEDQLRGVAGDLDGDGFLDLVLAASGHPGATVAEGAVWVYPGGPGGPAAAPGPSFAGGVAYAKLGGDLEVLGDTDGDGFVDLAVSAGSATVGGLPGAGEVRIHRGGALGLEALPSRALAVPQEQAYLGGVAAPGDVDGDGLADAWIGTPLHDAPDPAGGEPFADAGAAFLFSGAAGASAAWTLYGPRAGYGVAGGLGAGDVDRDGLGDLLVGAPSGFDDGQTGEGRFSVYLGVVGGIGASAVPALQIESEIPGAALGASPVIGDFDGDGCPELALGVTGHPDGLARTGAVAVFHWARDGRACAPPPGDTAAVPGPPPADPASYSGVALGCAAAPPPGPAGAALALALAASRRRVRGPRPRR